MNELIYGFWKGVVFDTRRGICADLTSFPSSKYFNRGNPITGIATAEGFLIYDHRVTLLRVLLDYYRKTQEMSCGRCTPCRSGSVLIVEALEKAAQGQGQEVDWDFIRQVAIQMADTSLCGIGRTSPIALIAAIDHFREDLVSSPGVYIQNGDSFSLATAPCIEACPAHVEVPRYIDYIRDGRPDMAKAVLLRHYPLVGSCGRVCVRPCENACLRGQIDAPVSIKDLKRFASDHAQEVAVDCAKKAPADQQPQVAVIGAGPAGLNCAYHLLQHGIGVTIYEKENHAGGMARLGIPSYRLPNNILDSEIGIVEALGAQFQYGKTFGKDFNLDTLFAKGYKAVFLGLGCANGQYLGLPGEDTSARGYLKGLDFLLQLARAQENDDVQSLSGDVVVVGCGNVAMDCCRSARRLLKDNQHKVIVSYRRTQASAPADKEEIIAAGEEGIEFQFLTAPVEILTRAGQVCGIKLIRMQETEPDESGRRRVQPIEGSEFVVPCSTVIAAIGQRLDRSVFSDSDGIEFTDRGTIVVDDSMLTTRDGVFAGGDAATGPTSLIRGLETGETAAASIREYLMTGMPGFLARRRMSEIIRDERLMSNEAPQYPAVAAQRVPLQTLCPESRVGNWQEVEEGFDIDEAYRQASRCMRCYQIITLSTLKPIPGKSAVEEL